MAAEQVPANDAFAKAAAGRYRWVIVGLLLAAMVINYVDRQTIGFLKGDLSKQYGWSEGDYADIIFWFQGAYAVAYLGFGRVMDRLGARYGLGLAFLIWQLAHMSNAFARSTLGFIGARVMLGIGEGGAFPGGVKAMAEWFPKSERAFATGVFNAGTNLGAIITPLIIPAVVLAWGWRAAFIVTGLGGLVWLPIWLLVYRTPRETRGLSAAELAHIESDPPDAVEKVSWTRLLKVRETWAFAAGKFLIDPIWWMFLFWLPDFMQKRHGLDLKTFGPPIVVIYLVSDVGSVVGGWASSRLIQRGWTINRARKTTMLVSALLATPVAFAAFADNLWLAVAIIGLATAAHQAFSATLYAMPGDVFPRAAVGSVAGIGGMIGAIGGMVMSKYAGFVLDKLGTYTPIFVVAASAYLLALGAIQLLSPKLEPVKL